MNISFVIEKNIGAILKLNQTVHEKHYHIRKDVFEPYHPEKFKLWFENFIQNDNVICILAKKEASYIGYAIIIHKKASLDNPLTNPEFECWYIDQMSILENFQSKGIGKKMIDFIKRLANKKGINSLQLDVWSENQQAKTFYIKNHFTTIREIMEIKLN